MIILLVQGCALDAIRSSDGCESFCYLCIGQYQHCGEKGIKIIKEGTNLHDVIDIVKDGDIVEETE